MIRDGLQRRLAWTLILTALIPLIAFSVALHFQIKEIREQTVLRLQDTTVTIATDFTRHVIERRQTLEAAAVAISPLVNKEALKKSRELLDVGSQLLYIAGDRFVQSVVVLTDGTLLDYSISLSMDEAASIAQEVRESWVFRQTLRTAYTSIGEPVTTNGHTSVLIGVPIFDAQPQPRVRAVLASRMDVSALLEAIASPLLRHRTGIRIVDRQGKVLTGFGHWPESDALLTSTSIEEPDWVLESATVASVLSRVYVITSFGFFLVFLIALACYLTARVHFQKLETFFEQLNADIASLASGQTLSTVSPVTSDASEVRQILEKFRSMARKVTQSRQALEHVNEMLESRVEERTQALKTSNDELSAINALLVPLQAKTVSVETPFYLSALALVKSFLHLQSLSLTNTPVRETPCSVSIATADARWLSAQSDRVISEETRAQLIRFTNFLNIGLANESLIIETQNQHARLSALFGAMSEGFALVLPGPELDFCNQTFLRLLALVSDNSVTAQTFFCEMNRQKEVLEPLYRALSTPDTTAIWDVKLLGNVHRYYALRSFAVPLTSERGESLRATALLIRDITHEYEVSKLKDDVLALTSHELNTPITTISLGLETLTRRADKIAPEMQKTLMANLLKETERLKELIHDWLDIAMLNNGVLQCHRREIDLVRLVKLQTASWQTRRHVAVTLNIEPTSSTVFADPNRIGQVLSNLLENALRYNDKASPVIVVSMKENAMQYCVDVTDNGMGLTQDEAVQIFERFYRGERAKKQCPNGSGLGLAICRAIMQAHGGTLTILQTVPGEGTTFRLTFIKAENDLCH